MNDGIQVLCTNLFNYLSNMPVGMFQHDECMYLMGAGVPSWTGNDYKKMVAIYKRVHGKPPTADLDPDETLRQYEQDDLNEDFERDEDESEDDWNEDDYGDWMNGL